MVNFMNNTTQLQDLLEKVNALPKAGSGGGGIETCTVTIKKDTSRGNVYLHEYTTYDRTYNAFHSGKDGGANDFNILPSGSSGNYVIENVVVGSIVNIYGTGGITSWSMDGEFNAIRDSNTSNIFKVLGNVVATFRDDD